MKHDDKGNISKLLEIMKRLRDPDNGCPWDVAQTFATIAPYTVEEAYEVADTIERGAYDELPDELGDLLFQVVFYAQMAAEEDWFDFADVVETICEKMRRRHPHVFADSGEQPDWEGHKRAEREQAGNSGVLAGIPTALPALTRAYKLGKRAASVGFDWPSLPGVRAKLAEETQELDAALQAGIKRDIEAEIGDVFFALTNLCRHVGVDPEQALRGCNRRFEGRFTGVEQSVAASELSWEQHTLDVLETYWQQAKQAEKFS